MRSVINCAAALLALVTAVNPAFAQTGNGSVGGIVQDSTKALVPAVNVTLTNVDTGVVSTQITNETGAYNFPSVPPGNYKLTAELPGFRQAVANDLRVGPNAQVRWNFTLEVASLNSDVEVSVAADQVLTESTASVGAVLPEQKVRELPIVGQNVLDLINVLPGFRQGPNGTQATGYTVGGLGLDTVNTTINGLSTNSARDAAQFWGYQTFTTNVINPDMVGEVRLIIAPVDAELGRGNAQFRSRPEVEQTNSQAPPSLTLETRRSMRTVGQTTKRGPGRTGTTCSSTRSVWADRSKRIRPSSSFCMTRKSITAGN